MKSVLVVLLLLITAGVYGQTDSTKKSYLGLLKLTETYQDEKNWNADVQGIVNQHFQRLVKLKNEGMVELAGPTTIALNSPDMVGVVVFYAKNDQEATQFMQDDPAVKNKIMTAKALPFSLAISKCK